jgi:hypothetical protein
MTGTVPLLACPFAINVTRRCSIVVLAKAVYWAAVEKLDPP